MRLYELLNPGPSQQPTAGNPAAPITQPMAVQATAPPWPQQIGVGKQANGLTDFFSTPHPIGNSAGPLQPASASGTNAAGQPAFVDKSVNSTFIGDINRGLTPVPAPKP